MIDTSMYHSYYMPMFRSHLVPYLKTGIYLYLFLGRTPYLAYFGYSFAPQAIKSKEEDVKMADGVVNS